MESFLEAIVGIFGIFFRFIAGLVGVVLAFVGIVLLIVLVVSLFTVPLQLFVPFDLWVFPFPDFINSLFAVQWMGFLTTAAIFLIVGVPLALIILAGLRMVFGFDNTSRFIGATLFLLWMIGLAILAFVVITALFA